MVAIDARTDSAEAKRRVAPWILDCLAICPAATIVLLAAGELALGPVMTLAAALTIDLYETVDGLALSRAAAAEHIGFLLAGLLAAIAPALGMALAERGGLKRAASFVSMLPVWLVVVMAPALVVLQGSPSIDPSTRPFTLACAFMLTFSAVAAGVTLAFAIWARHHPDAVGREPAAPKAASKPVQSPQGPRKTCVA